MNSNCSPVANAVVDIWQCDAEGHYSQYNQPLSGVYAAKGQNPTSNAGDMVFADSVASELASVSGDPVGGYSATYTVGVSL